MSNQVIEHIVLFKVKDNTDSSKINALLSGLNALISLDMVLHLTAGPILRSRFSSLNFTHMLHSRYSSKEDLAAYMMHPDHLSLVKETMIPICDSLIITDWIADDLRGSIAPPPGSAMSVTLLKPKEDLGEEAKSEILGVIEGTKNRFDSIDEITCGENFSPARAKGFSIGSLAIFAGVKEMEAVDANEEVVVKSEMEKVKDYVESAVAVDYVITSSPPSVSV